MYTKPGTLPWYAYTGPRSYLLVCCAISRAETWLSGKRTCLQRLVTCTIAPKRSNFDSPQSVSHEKFTLHAAPFLGVVGRGRPGRCNNNNGSAGSSSSFKLRLSDVMGGGEAKWAKKGGERRREREERRGEGREREREREKDTALLLVLC